MYLEQTLGGIVHSLSISAITVVTVSRIRFMDILYTVYKVQGGVGYDNNNAYQPE